MRFERYVAIGDSSTEGIDDPDGQGGYRGWANRLAERIALEQGSLLYANLGVRGRRTRQILDEQLEPALAMRPDLVTLFCGTNDAVARHFDTKGVAADLESMQRRLVDSGATVLGFTLPDLEQAMPLGKHLTARVEALNEILRSVSASTGATLVDFAADPSSSDRRIWSDDGFHGNTLGHTLIAAALAQALGLPDREGVLAEPLPALPHSSRPRQLARDARWLVKHFIPWIWRHSRGRSSGDGLEPKQPELVEIRP